MAIFFWLAPRPALSREKLFLRGGSAREKQAPVFFVNI